MYATQSVCYFMSLQNHSWYINWHQSVQNSHSTYYQHWINSTQHDPRWAKRQCLWCSTAFPGVLQERKQHKTDCLCRHHWAVSQQVMSRHIISMTARHSTYIYICYRLHPTHPAVQHVIDPHRVPEILVHQADVENFMSVLNGYSEFFHWQTLLRICDKTVIKLLRCSTHLRDWDRARLSATSCHRAHCTID